MKKRHLFLFLSLLFCLLLLPGCGNSKTQETEIESLSALYEQMIAGVELPSMIQMEEDYITNYYGIDLSTFEEYVFAAAEDALLAENIILLKLKDGEDNSSIVALLETMIKQKKFELESYLPEQYKIVEKSSVATSGNYVVLIISSQKEALEEYLPEALR